MQDKLTHTASPQQVQHDVQREVRLGMQQLHSCCTKLPAPAAPLGWCGQFVLDLYSSVLLMKPALLFNHPGAC